MSSLRIPEAKSVKDQNAFSDLALNAVSVLGNFAMQCKRVLPKEDSQVLSFVKCLSFISAGNNYHLAKKNIESAHAIKDAYGVTLNEVKLTHSIAQFVSGILYFSSLGLSWAGTITSFKIVVTTSKVFSKTTALLSNMAILLMLLNTSMKLHEQSGFQQEVTKLQGNPEAIAHFLKEKMNVPEEFQQNLQAALEKKYQDRPKTDKLQKKIDKIFSREISKKQQARAAYMKRVTDRGCIELIDKMDITDRTSIGPTIQKVQEVAHANIRFNGFLISLGSIGLLGLAVSFIPGSAFVTLSTILGLIPTVAFSASGINDLVRSLQNNKEGLYDRLLLLATGCVGVATSTALYALTENPLVKLTAALFAIVWVTLLYYVSLHLENQAKKA